MVDIIGFPHAANWDGSILVGNFQNQAAFWDAAGWHDLRSLLVDDYHLDLSAWAGLGAAAVSADGNTIVGSGFNAILGTEGWVAHVAFGKGAGDLNCDDRIDFNDINAFVMALTDRAAYEAQYPTCRWRNGDLNNDNQVDWSDINPFVALLGRQ